MIQLPPNQQSPTLCLFFFSKESPVPKPKTRNPILSFFFNDLTYLSIFLSSWRQSLAPRWLSEQPYIAWFNFDDHFQGRWLGGGTKTIPGPKLLAHQWCRGYDCDPLHMLQSASLDRLELALHVSLQGSLGRCYTCNSPWNCPKKRVRETRVWVKWAHTRLTNELTQ